MYALFWETGNEGYGNLQGGNHDWMVLDLHLFY